MDDLAFGTDYLGSLHASVDWVAGGNFDGYICRTRIRFERGTGVVVKVTEAVDESRYDGHFRSQFLQGSYEATDHGTITCRFPDHVMRGVLSGKRKEFLIFSAQGGGQSWTECYERAQRKWL